MSQFELTVIPEQFRGQLATLPKELHPALRYVTADMLAGCTSHEDVLIILQATAEQIQTDAQARYYPAVWKIDHESQRFVDEQRNSFEKVKGVMLYFMPTRGLWVDGAGKVPLCSAMGQWLRGKASDDAQERWSKTRLYNPLMPIDWAGQERDCSTCPFNEFGSDPKTGTGKGCKEKYRQFLLPLSPDDDQFTGEAIMLNAPPTSLKKVDEYVSTLKRYKPPGKTKVEPKTTLHVVTEFTLEPAEGQGQVFSRLVPKPIRLLTAKELLFVYGIRKLVAEVADTIEIEYGETYDQGSESGGTPAGTTTVVGVEGEEDVPF